MTNSQQAKKAFLQWQPPRHRQSHTDQRSEDEQQHDFGLGDLEVVTPMGNSVKNVIAEAL